MHKFLKYILRNVKRNKVRTFLTVFGVMIAVAIFCFLASLGNSMTASIDKVAEDTMLVVGEKDQY